MSYVEKSKQNAQDRADAQAFRAAKQDAAQRDIQNQSLAEGREQGAQAAVEQLLLQQAAQQQNTDGLAAMYGNQYI